MHPSFQKKMNPGVRERHSPILIAKYYIKVNREEVSVRSLMEPEPVYPGKVAFPGGPIVSITRTYKVK
jgi:hypothetical protein